MDAGANESLIRLRPTAVRLEQLPSMCLHCRFRSAHCTKGGNGRIQNAPNERVLSCKEGPTQNALVLSQMQVYAALMTAQIRLPVKTLAASRMKALDLFPRFFVLEHVTAKVVHTLESLAALIAMEPRVLCCGLDSARPVQ